MWTSMRIATLLWSFGGLLACETGDAAPVQMSGDTNAEQVPSAAPDAPIAAGERAPQRPAGEDPSEAPDPAAAGSLEAALSRLAQRYAGGWVAASAAFEADLEAGGSSDYQLVLGSAHCYRVLAAGASSLEDVDLRLFDPNGVQVQQDEGTDRFPVVGQSYPVCPPVPGAYRLQARAVSGAGRLRVQAFHGP